MAQRVNHLFDLFKAAYRRKATDQRVADHVTQQTGMACSRHWVRDVRTAKIRAPALSRLEAIASYFGAPRRYLFDDPDTTGVDDGETALRVNLLFARSTDNADGQHATDQHVADRIAQVTGYPCPPRWVRDLRDAKIRTPDQVRLAAIASYFGAPRRFLVNDTAKVGDTQTTISKLEANGIHLRELGGFSTPKLRIVAALIRSLAEQIPDNTAT